MIPRRWPAALSGAICAASLVSCDRAVGGNANDHPGPIGEALLAIQIGGDAGASHEYQFASIGSVLVAPDGRIWVADATSDPWVGRGSGLIRMYDGESGAFLRTVGGAGEGPGEYRNPEGLSALADGRIAVRDVGSRGKVILYSSDGDHESTWTAASLGVGFLTWPSRGRDPLQVDSSGLVWMPFSRLGEQRGLGEPAYLRISPEGVVMDTVPFPAYPEVPPPVVEVGTSSIVVPFQPMPLVAWNPAGGFAVGRTDQYRIDVLPPVASVGTQIAQSGSRVVALDVAPVPITSGQRNDARDELQRRVASIPGAHPGDLPEIATVKQLLTGLRFAEDGRLFVGVSVPSTEVEGVWVELPTYDVFEPDGAYEGRVVFPESFALMGVRGDLVWGVFRDWLGVESVGVFNLYWP